MLSFWTKSAAISLIFGVVACAPTVQEAAKDATKGAAPEAVAGAAKGLDEPETRERIVHLMESPEMQQAIRDLAKSVTQGATDGLSDVQLANRTEQLSSGITSIAAQATRGVVDAALTQAASAADEKRLQQIAAAASDTAVRSATHALAEEIPTTLAPALAEAMQRDVAPSVRAMLSAPELRMVLAQTTYQMAREAVLGSNQALAELEQKRNKVGTLARVSGWLANGGWILLVVVVGAAGLVALGAAFFRSRHRTA